MRIYTMFMVGGILAVTLTAVAGGGAYISYQKYERANAREKFYYQVRVNVSQLIALTSDYLIYPSERSKAQLRMKHESLGRAINNPDIDVVLQEKIFEKIRRYHVIIGNLHSRVVEADFNRTGNDSLSPQIAAIISQLLTTKQAMASEAVRLSMQSRTIRENAELQLIWYFSSLIGLIFVMFLMLWLAIVFRIIRPFQTLHEGIIKFGEGDFDFRFFPASQNEIDDVAASFDQMAEVLCETITARDNLNREVTQKSGQFQAALESEKKYSTLQSKFISLASHELRTPLAIIDSTAQRLVRSKKVLSIDVLQEKSKTIRKAVGRMTDLIENTLYAACIEEDKIEMKLTEINLSELLRRNCSYQAEISPSHNIHIDITSLPKTIYADERLMEIVFSNLLSNAIKFTPENSSIEIGGWEEDSHAVVSIIDYGVGIAKDDLPHMFQNFFRAKTAEGIKGTGIGLSVSKEFVEMHGGSMMVDSIEGEGSTFTVRMPIGDR